MAIGSAEQQFPVLITKLVLHLTTVVAAKYKLIQSGLRSTMNSTTLLNFCDWIIIKSTQKLSSFEKQIFLMSLW